MSERAENMLALCMSDKCTQHTADNKGNGERDREKMF